MSGPGIDTADYSVAEIPLFVRGGALLPLAARSGEASTSPDLIWTLWLDGINPVNGTASVYEDDGTSAVFQGSAGARTNASFSYGGASTRTLLITVFPTEGAYTGMPPMRTHSVQVRAPPGAPGVVSVDGSKVPRVQPGSVGPGWWISDGASSPLTEPAGAVMISTGRPASLATGVRVAVLF